MDFGFLVSKTRIPNSKANFTRFRNPDFLIRDDKVDTSALNYTPNFCEGGVILAVYRGYYKKKDVGTWDGMFL